MGKFSFKRMMRVIKWNRVREHQPINVTKMLLLIVFFIVPIGSQLWGLFLYDLAYAQAHYAEALGEMQKMMETAFYVATALMFMTSMSVLVKRETRTQELTLPATNLERYAAHLLSAAFRLVAAIACLFVMIDIVQYVVMGCYVGFDVVQWGVVRSLFDGGVHWMALPVLLMVATSLPMATCIWHKRGLVYAFVFWLTVLVLLTLALIPIGMASYSEDEAGLAARETNSRILLWVLGIIPAVLCLVNLCVGYRFYCRAQLSSQRNP